MNHQLRTTDNWPLIPNYIVHKYLRLYICRETFTNVMSALQNHFFMQNKPKFKKVKSNVTIEMKKDYVQMDIWSIRKNEPKTNPNEPKTNPILANKTPIRTQFKPNFRAKIMPPSIPINVWKSPGLEKLDRLLVKEYQIDKNLKPIKRQKTNDFVNLTVKKLSFTGCSSVWPERLLWEQEAVGSNPITPIEKSGFLSQKTRIFPAPLLTYSLLK